MFCKHACFACAWEGDNVKVEPSEGNFADAPQLRTMCGGMHWVQILSHLQAPKWSRMHFPPVAARKNPQTYKKLN